MLNEEKVILMTQMASYEENEGKKNMAIGRYFRSDYIAIQVLKSILCATIAYGVCFALFVFYDFENFMQDIYKMDLIGFGKNVLLYYGITVVVYGVIFKSQIIIISCKTSYSYSLLNKIVTFCFR